MRESNWFFFLGNSAEVLDVLGNQWSLAHCVSIRYVFCQLFLFTYGTGTRYQNQLRFYLLQSLK
jgi:hypothetical protein